MAEKYYATCPECEYHFPAKIHVTCPECEYHFPVKIPAVKIPESEEKIKERVTCLKCGHAWNFEGLLNKRVHCPVCHSTRNKFNVEVFGAWKRENLRTGDE